MNSECPLYPPKDRTELAIYLKSMIQEVPSWIQSARFTPRGSDRGGHLPQKYASGVSLVVAAPTQDSTSVRYIHLGADLPMLCRPLAKKARRTPPAVHYTHHLAHASCDRQIADDETDRADGAGGADGCDFGGCDDGGGAPDAAGAADGVLKMLMGGIDGWILPDHQGITGCRKWNPKNYR